MQVVRNDGYREMIEDYNEEKMLNNLKRKDVKRVEVFNANPDNLAYKKKHLGVKKRGYKN